MHRARARRGSLTCCWYHGGDWHRVNVMARTVLARARTNGTDVGGMKEAARAYAHQTGAGEWQAQALVSLFDPGVAIQADDEDYTNGNHRTRAMLDAGVPRTIVLQTAWPSAEGRR